MIQQFNFPTPVRFGSGAIRELADALKAVSSERPFVITDRQVLTVPFFLDDIVNPLQNAGLDPRVFGNFSGNPIEEHVMAGLASYRENDCDAIVMVGGGAPMDVAKAVALLVHNEGDLFDYEDGKEGARTAIERLPYMVAIPTTAGTGSEVGRSSVISDNVTKAKKIIFDPKMLPNLVIADPELTTSLPKSVTAATGIDALTHLLEAFLAKNYHPMCDGIALEGISLVAKHLADVIVKPDDTEGRSGMLIASLMGAVAFQKGLGVNHSCAHALSTHFDTHHGLANALMLPACMAFNAKAVPERFEIIARRIGLETTEDCLSWISAIIEVAGIKIGLRHYGVEITDDLINTAFEDVCHQNNPCLVSKDDFRKLFQQAY
ncbi:MAG: iron-containing alcohol dehydrogenase [Pseudobacteriovorax sp.]|nr:iron-containing alcohol dehydrogenase [Pseudobacteriovorax sp.]